MTMLLFLFGCPGSGKSTVSRIITMLVRDRGWIAHPINDYGILYLMYQNDTKHDRFYPADHDGFNVLDATVYEEALEKLKEQAQNLMRDSTNDVLIIIEFSRNDYRRALKHFDRDFLCHANFLFLDADIDTCIQRVNKRIIQRSSLDDHFVPNDVIACHCQDCNRQYMESGLKLDYDIGEERVRILDTRGSIEELMEPVEQFVDSILPALASIPK
jgi:gluconate kinase